MVECVECGGYVNLFSEGETYDYTEDENGETIYLCEECVKNLVFS